MLLQEQCYHSTVETPNNVVDAPELQSNQRDTDPRITLYTVFASSTDESSVVCVVADDTEVYICLRIALEWKSVLSARYIHPMKELPTMM